MSMLTRLAATGAAPTVYADDVFSTFLYTGNGSSQTITNGIDLSGKGGMVWIKARQIAESHLLADTTRGTNSIISSDGTSGALTGAPWNAVVTAFNSNGFTVGTTASASSYIYANWTFREQAKFFDVVTWSGAANQTVSHSLNAAPGCIFIKRTGASENWYVYHRGLPNTNPAALDALILNSTAAYTAGSGYVGDVTSTNFKVYLNADSYVAYLFGHDTSANGLIQCGSYTGNGSATGPTVTLGWEPQWLMIKRATGGTGSWNIFDNMRGMTVGGNDWYLQANATTVETGANWITPTATGFQIVSTSTEVNNNTDTYVYVAIRRSNKPPTAGTQVFQPTVYTGTNVDNRLVDTTIAPDMVWVRQRNDTVLGGMVVADRLRGQPYMLTGTTATEVTTADAFDQQLVSATEYGTAFSAMNGFYCGNDATAKLNTDTTSNNHVALAFKRAAKFFDVVCYTGTGVAGTVSHNLGVAPEMFFVKTTGSGNWTAGTSLLGSFSGNYYNGSLNSNGTFSNTSNFTVSGLGNSTLGLTNGAAVNASATTYVAYLFASLPGISKIGTYTGNGGTAGTNGTSQTINCGFTAGARFVLIKRTDNTGDWYVFDSARGIVAASDPYLLLNSTAAEVTTVDAVDADNSGFIVNQTSGTDLNVTSATYLYLAIA